MDASTTRPGSTSVEMAATSMARKRQAHGSSGDRRVLKEKKRRKLILDDSDSGEDEFSVSPCGKGDGAQKVLKASGCEEKMELESECQFTEAIDSHVSGNNCREGSDQEQNINVGENSVSGSIGDISVKTPSASETNGTGEFRISGLKICNVGKDVDLRDDNSCLVEEKVRRKLEVKQEASIEEEEKIVSSLELVDKCEDVEGERHKKTRLTSKANGKDSLVDRECSKKDHLSNGEEKKSETRKDRRDKFLIEKRKLEAKRCSRIEAGKKVKEVKVRKDNSRLVEQKERDGLEENPEAGVDMHVTVKKTGNRLDGDKGINDEKNVLSLEVVDKREEGEGERHKKSPTTAEANRKDCIANDESRKEVSLSDSKDRKMETKMDTIKMIIEKRKMEAMRCSRLKVREKSRDGSNREKNKMEIKHVPVSEVVKKKEEGGRSKMDQAIPAVHPDGEKDMPVGLTMKKEALIEEKKVTEPEFFDETLDIDGNKKVAHVPIKKNVDFVSDRKRHREVLQTETVEKKIRSVEDTKGNAEECNETGEKNLAHLDKQTDTSEDSVSRSKPEEKSVQDNAVNDSSPEKEKVQGVERSEGEPLKKKKERNYPLRGVMRVAVERSRHKGVKRHAKGEESSSDDQKVYNLDRTRSLRNRERVTKHPSVSGESEVFEKSSSSVKVGKKQLGSGKQSKKRTKSCDGETEPGTSSPKSDDGADRETNIEKKLDVSNEENADEPTGKVSLTEKQKLREQIKQILLDAGWKIDLRPRRGRNYQDAVYISPLGGSGYWSVTKAYDVYLNNCKSKSDENNQIVCKKTSISLGSDQSQEGASSTRSPIPKNLLSMLKRNVVNKRLGIKTGKTEKKLGVKKNEKGTISRKDRSHKQHKNDEGRVTKKSNLRARNQNKRGRSLLARGTDIDGETDSNDYIPYDWKRTIFSWMIDLEVLNVNGKVKYMNEDKSQAMMEGWVTRDGIRCSCCSKTITVSKFEIHAGSKLCEPYQNIYVEDQGISLLQCLLKSWKKEKSKHSGFHEINIDGDDPNDDACGICADGGDLICCDSCPSTFHLNCLGIKRLPSGDWNCTHCCCKYCGLVSSATSEDSSTASALLTCSQCEKKYHQECMPQKDVASVDHNIPEASFCGQSCCMVFSQLEKLLGIKNDLNAGLSWRLVRRLDKNSSKYESFVSQWTECNSKSAVAFAVMDECFEPIMDSRTGINLVQNIVYNYGSNITRLSYNGFYTFILEREEEIIAAASVRIHGKKLAEMPFIGTRNMYRRQGMCRQLLNGIESALCSLDVETLIIPAIAELKETWVNVFGFKPLDQSQQQEVRSVSLLMFPGTGLLLKPIPKKKSVEHYENAGRDNGTCILSTLCVSDEIVVQSGLKDKNVDIVSREPECHSPLSNCSEAVADVDDEFQIISTEPKLASSSGATEQLNNKEKDDDEPKLASPCGDNVHINNKGNNIDIVVPEGSHVSCEPEFQSLSNTSEDVADVDDKFLIVSTEAKLASACMVNVHMSDMGKNGNATDKDEGFQIISSKETKRAVPLGSIEHAENPGKDEDAVDVSILDPVDGGSENHPAIIDHRESGFAENGLPVLPSIQPNLPSEVEGVVKTEHEIRVESPRISVELT